MKKIAALLSFTLMTALLMTGAHAEDILFGINHGKGLRLRTQPSYSAKVVKNYRAGTWVEILGEEGTFYRVITEDGHEGYMDKGYVTPVQSKDSGVWATVENGTKFVNVRAEGNSESTVIDHLHTGDRVEVLDRGKYYHFVRIRGDTLGYISNAFLRIDGENVVSRTYIYSVNKSSSVYLSEGPGPRYDTIASYTTGNKVNVLVKGYNWYRVEVNGNVGFMPAKYLEKPE